MSFILSVGDQTVWSPSLSTGAAYVSCAQALGTVFEADPGFTFVAEDFVEADPEVLRAFAVALLARARASDGHVVLCDLIDAVLIPGLVMLERAGMPIDLATDPTRTRKVASLRGLPQ